jgi:hypothetical protein
MTVILLRHWVDKHEKRAKSPEQLEKLAQAKRCLEHQRKKFFQDPLGRAITTLGDNIIRRKEDQPNDT